MFLPKESHGDYNVFILKRTLRRCTPRWGDLRKISKLLFGYPVFGQYEDLFFFVIIFEFHKFIFGVDRQQVESFEIFRKC